MAGLLPAGLDMPAGFTANPFPGMTTVTVRWVQTQLRAAGRSIAVDGVYGPMTASALAEYAQAASAPTVVMPMPSDSSRLAIMPELETALRTRRAAVGVQGSAQNNSADDSGPSMGSDSVDIATKAIALALGLACGVALTGYAQRRLGGGGGRRRR